MGQKLGNVRAADFSGFKNAFADDFASRQREAYKNAHSNPQFLGVAAPQGPKTPQGPR